MLLDVFVILIGLALGSFLNVCIFRLPGGISLVRPSSFCTQCRNSIPWYDNIPVLSYIRLGGKCRFCKEKISLRYPVVELLTALLVFVLFKVYGFTFGFLYYGILVLCLIVATFSDIEQRIIPDEVSIGGLVVGLALNIFVFLKPEIALDSFLGILVGGGTIFLTGFLFDFVYFRLLKKPPIQGETSSMGFGDVKLLAMIGAFLGWQKVLLVFFLAPFFALVFGIINIIIKKDHTLPYGPFLSLAAFICIFWADKIIRLIIPYY